MVDTVQTSVWRKLENPHPCDLMAKPCHHSFLRTKLFSKVHGKAVYRNAAYLDKGRRWIIFLYTLKVFKKRNDSCASWCLIKYYKVSIFSVWSILQSAKYTGISHLHQEEINWISVLNSVFQSDKPEEVFIEWL